MSNDLDLWEAVKAGDETAFTKLFYRYSPKIYSTAFSYIKHREACEEIVHDIFMTLWLNRKELEVRSFSAYLTSAARYRVYKYLTSDNKRVVSYKENPEDYQKNVVYNTGYSNIVYNDLEQELDLFLSDLPKRCREIFLMSRRQLLSNDEIAEKLGVSRRTVENQLTRALRHLRLKLRHLPLILFIITVG